MMDDDIADSIRQMIETQIMTMNTTLPGVVVSYDGKRAVVKPSLSKRTADDNEIEPPNIISVPVVWPGSANGGLKSDLKPGDGVMLHFSQRSLEGWLSGVSGAPDDPRIYDLSDAIAVPGLSPSLEGFKDGVRLHWGGTSLELKEGSASLSVGSMSIEISDSEIRVNGKLIINGQEYLQHTHKNVQSGSAVSGPVNGG